MILTYATIAIIVATVAFAITDSRREQSGWDTDYPGLCAVIAGVAWPVLAVGLLQLLVLTAAVKLASFIQRSAARSGVFAATAK